MIVLSLNQAQAVGLVIGGVWLALLAGFLVVFTRKP